MPKTKICIGRCGKRKSLTKFTPGYARCRECINLERAERRAADPQHRQDKRRWNRDYKKRLREQYGVTCKQCGKGRKPEYYEGRNQICNFCNDAKSKVCRGPCGKRKDKKEFDLYRRVCKACARLDQRIYGGTGLLYDGNKRKCVSCDKDKLLSSFTKNSTVCKVCVTQKNKRKTITCEGPCGKRKKKSEFPAFKTPNYTSYFTKCQACVNIQRNERMTNDPAYYKHILELSKKSSRKATKNLTDAYVRIFFNLKSFGLTREDIPDALIELRRRQLITRREYKQEQLRLKEEGKRICSCCGEIKDLLEYSYSSQKLFGAHKSGMCKKCDGLVKKYTTIEIRNLKGELNG